MPESLEGPVTPKGPSWRHDLPASIVVVLVALPLCLGVALASGAPLISGVIAGIIGGIVVGSLSGSHLMVSGPAAGLTAIVLAAITQLGDYRAFLVAVVIGGLVQLLLAAVRAGIIGYYFPSAVIKGMLSAIGLVLILKQVPHALGYDSDAMGDSAFAQADGDNTFTGIAHAFALIEPGALLISLVSLAILFLWPLTRLARVKLLPAPLVVVAASTALNAAFVASQSAWALGGTHLVSLPLFEGATGILSAVTFPSWQAITEPAVWRIGLTLGIVASIETLLSLEATDKMDPLKREAPPNRELFAQGIGNTLSGLIGGLPVTGVIVRSAANVGAGARTRWSAIAHGAILLLAVAMIPAALNHIPLAALAAILLHTGWKLAHPGIGRQLVSLGRSQAIPYFTTVVAILFTDLLVGISVGLSVGAFFILADTLRSPPFTEVSAPGAVLRRLELHTSVNFLNKGALLSALEAVPDGSRLELDGRQVRRIDLDALEVIHNFSVAAKSRGIDYRLVGIPPMPAGASSAH